MVRHPAKAIDLVCLLSSTLVWLTQWWSNSLMAVAVSTTFWNWPHCIGVICFHSFRRAWSLHHRTHWLSDIVISCAWSLLKRWTISLNECFWVNLWAIVIEKLDGQKFDGPNFAWRHNVFPSCFKSDSDHWSHSCHRGNRRRASKFMTLVYC